MLGIVLELDEPEFDEQPVNAIGRLVGEVRRPRNQQVAVVGSRACAHEPVEHAGSDCRSGVHETGTGAPGDVVDPGLDRSLEQQPRRLGRFNVAVAVRAGVRGKLVLL